MNASPKVFFLGNTLWDELDRVGSLEQTKTVAVPFYTDGSAFTWREDDRLIVNADETVIAGGQTDARALLAAQDSGATIFSHRNLHAKLLIAGDRAIVSSANASRASRGLKEAGVLLEEPGAVADLRLYMERLIDEAEELKPAALQRLAAIPTLRIARRKGRERISLRTAFAENDDVLANCAYGIYSGHTALSKAQVASVARRDAVPTPRGWTWFESDDSPAAYGPLKLVCNQKPLVHWRVAYDKDLRLRTFFPHDAEARVMYDLKRVRGQLVSFMGPRGFDTGGIDLSLERSELAETLTRGAQSASTKLLRRVDNASGVIALADLHELYALGTQ